jgi:hypothetical protein
MSMSRLRNISRSFRWSRSTKWRLEAKNQLQIFRRYVIATLDGIILPPFWLRITFHKNCQPQTPNRSQLKEIATRSQGIISLVDVYVLILSSLALMKNGIVFRVELILIMYLIIARVSFEIMTLDARPVPWRVSLWHDYWYWLWIPMRIKILR